MSSLDWLVFAVGSLVTGLLVAGLGFTISELRRLSLTKEPMPAPNIVSRKSA